MNIKENQLQLVETEIDRGQELETSQDLSLENIEGGQNRLDNPNYRAYLMTTPFYQGLVNYLAK